MLEENDPIFSDAHKKEASKFHGDYEVEFDNACVMFFRCINPLGHSKFDDSIAMCQHMFRKQHTNVTN